MLSSVVPDSTIRMHLDSLLMYRTARVHARGSSISMWQSSWFNQHKISLSVNQSPTPKGVVSLGMVLRVRLLEVGGSTGGALGKAFFPFTFEWALGNALFTFTFFCATATMGQVCFTAISSNRACPTVFIALSTV